jgi:hypothetical protein
MGDFEGALSKFTDAQAEDVDFAEADNGLGWTRLRLGALRVAVGHFEAALVKGHASADPFAGMAVGYRDLVPMGLEAAAEAGKNALSRDARYIFVHDPDFDWRDLRLILAQSYFGLHRYSEAAAQVDSLGGIVPDPNSPRFVQELLLEIERLGDGI